MSTPKRIRLSRAKGWRKPEGAVVVSRPSRWGNPYIVHTHNDRCDADEATCPVWGSELGYREYRETHQGAVTAFRHLFEFPMIGDPFYPDTDYIREHLAGCDLCCWCAPDEPCHADALLEIANAATPITREASE